MPTKSKELITKDQVNEVLQFADGLYNGLNGYGYYATPFTQNQNLVDLNNNPLKPTYEKILKALESSPMDASTLVGYSEFMEVWDTIYGKTLKYYAGLLSFDLNITCTNAYGADYSSQEYEDDLKRVYKFLDKFAYKQEFRKIVKEVLRRETSYVWFRDSHTINAPIELDDGEKVVKDEHFALQTMPQNHCILTGYFNGGELLYDFDLNYFFNGTVDINLFAPALKKKFRESFDSRQEYIPSAPLQKRHGEFSMYMQCSPLDGAYAFKMDKSNFRQVPPLASLMKSTFNNTAIEDLQRDKNIASAYALLMGEIGVYDSAKSGEKANQFKISTDNMGMFLQLVQSGLKKNIKPVALPLEETRFAQFVDNSPLMSQYQLQSSTAQGASANSMVYTTNRLGQFEVEQQILTDYNFIKTLYGQFNQFLNFFVNMKTRKYKFSFEFDGLDYDFHRQSRIDNAIKLADKGIVMNESYYASVMGLSPQSFHRSLDEGHNSKFLGNLSLLLNANTTKDGSGSSGDKGGRPEVANDDMTDAGSVSNDYS